MNYKGFEINPVRVVPVNQFEPEKTVYTVFFGGSEDGVYNTIADAKADIDAVVAANANDCFE